MVAVNKAADSATSWWGRSSLGAKFRLIAVVLLLIWLLGVAAPAIIISLLSQAPAVSSVRPIASSQMSVADSAMLVALAAPRPVYVASAEQDKWADPKGEYLSAYHAGVVYRLLGKPALESPDMPAVNQPVMTTVGYHIRTGKHDVTDFDWQRYMDFADKHLGKP